MIGEPPPVCCLCGKVAPFWTRWTDYAGRVRHVCERHREISEAERNRMLLSGRRPSW